MWHTMVRPGRHRPGGGNGTGGGEKRRRAQLAFHLNRPAALVGGLDQIDRPRVRSRRRPHPASAGRRPWPRVRERWRPGDGSGRRGAVLATGRRAPGRGRGGGRRSRQRGWSQHRRRGGGAGAGAGRGEGLNGRAAVDRCGVEGAMRGVGWTGFDARGGRRSRSRRRSHGWFRPGGGLRFGFRFWRGQGALFDDRFRLGRGGERRQLRRFRPDHRRHLGWVLRCAPAWPTGRLHPQDGRGRWSNPGPLVFRGA